MSATFLDQVAREWLYKKTTGTNSQTPLGELEYLYRISVVGTSAYNLEELWLKKYIINEGKVPSDTTSLGTLWKEVVSAIGLVPSKYINDNKILFYRNAS